MAIIIIKESNAARIEAVLGKANGRAQTHTVTTCFEAMELAEACEQQLAILPKRDRVGATAVVQPNIQLPNSYGYQVTTTLLRIERRATGWALLSAEAVKSNHKQAMTALVTPTRGQVREIVKRTLDGFRLDHSPYM